MRTLQQWFAWVAGDALPFGLLLGTTNTSKFARPGCEPCEGTGVRAGDQFFVPCPRCTAAYRFGPQAAINRAV